MIPYEIIASPFTFWLAAVGTAFPAIDANPSGSWSKVGTSGDLNYEEEGVVVQHEQEIQFWRALGSTGPRKAFRISEALMMRLTLADLTLEQYALALNHNTITTTAQSSGVAGNKKIGLYRGLSVPQRALLIRGDGASPYNDALRMQFEVPIAIQIGKPQPTFTKGPKPAGLALEWAALEDPNAASTAERFGVLRGQTTVAG